MHQRVREFVAANVPSKAKYVVEIGARDINGGVRDLFGDAKYHGIDIEPGRGVDEVADACSWEPPAKTRPDVVVCLEVFEHSEMWPDIVMQVGSWAKPGTVFLITAAGPKRKPHSAVDGAELRDGEWYENVRPGALQEVLEAAGFEDVTVVEVADDVQGRGVRSGG